MESEGVECGRENVGGEGDGDGGGSRVRGGRSGGATDAGDKEGEGGEEEAGDGRDRRHHQWVVGMVRSPSSIEHFLSLWKYSITLT